MERECYFNEEFSPKKSQFNRIKLMFDGSCGPINPNGNIGVGYAIFNEDNNDVLAQGWGYRLYKEGEDSSNNVAEWLALEKGLELLIDMGYTYKQLYVCGDSALVIRQVQGNWGIREGRYFKTAVRTMRRFGDILRRATVSHVMREYNDYCDHLSNQYIDYMLNQHGVDTGGQFVPRKTKPSPVSKPKPYWKKPKYKKYK